MEFILFKRYCCTSKWFDFCLLAFFSNCYANRWHSTHFFLHKKTKSCKRCIINRSTLIFLYRKKLNHENAHNFSLSNDLSLKFLFGTNCSPFDYDEFTLYMNFIWHCTKKKWIKKTHQEKCVTISCNAITGDCNVDYTGVLSVTKIAQLHWEREREFFFAV